MNQGETHEVINQAPPLVGYDAFSTDLALGEALEREGGGWHREAVAAMGLLAGSEAVIKAGALANQNSPVLRTHDRFGHRIDEVEFHPAWHLLMQTAVSHELHAMPWRNPREGAHVARAAKYFLFTQMEQGHGCPITMTYAAIPALRSTPSVAEVWEPRIVSSSYDAAVRPASEKSGVIIGMAMTEKQGGSDVRANTTAAKARGESGPGAVYELTGHKWFVSAPMCDAFLMLAQAPGGLSCFLVPRWREDGSRNGLRLLRLKDKLGNRSNASSEMELHCAEGRMLGPEGRGVPTIIEMVNHTRSDCVMGSASVMRQALVQALHHTSHRSAFGARLMDKALMQNVLADLALDSEAATLLFMRLARALDRRSDKAFEAPFGRIATGISKYWVCKRTPNFVYEALECLGGNGYVEEASLARLYREAPVNSVWEGSGNVCALDVLRAMRKEPASIDALIAEVRLARGGNARLDAFADAVVNELADATVDEGGSRRQVERMALALQGSLVVRHSPKAVSDAFCATRLGGDWGHCYGTLPRGTDTAAILRRTWPVECR